MKWLLNIDEQYVQYLTKKKIHQLLYELFDIYEMIVTFS